MIRNIIFAIIICSVMTGSHGFSETRKTTIGQQPYTFQSNVAHIKKMPTYVITGDKKGTVQTPDLAEAGQESEAQNLVSPKPSHRLEAGKDNPSATSPKMPAANQRNKKTTIYFKKNFAHLEAAEKQKLDRMMMANPKAKITAFGYTCPLGPFRLNQKLALARVNAIEDYLNSRGIRLSQKYAKGKCCYVDKNILWKNRRVEIIQQ